MGRRRRSAAAENMSSRSGSSGHTSPPKRLRTSTDNNEGKRHLTGDEFLARISYLTARRVVKEARVLETVKIERHLKENRDSHRTSEYDLDRLIVRRGQSFKLTIEFDEAINNATDKVYLQFVTGARPQQSKGTVVRMPVGLTVNSKSTSGPPAGWACSTITITKNTVTVTVTPPPKSIIGKYQLFVETYSSQGNGEQSKDRFQQPEEMYILFNAWCQDDPIYLAEEEKRQEYVLNERGSIWMGSNQGFHPRRWNFGQFENPCLEAAIHLLNKSNISSVGMISPVLVIRAISALANSSDEDGGVLTGRWTKDYPPSCTKPWAWNGSVGILTQYMATQKAVEYGQCWVFSGLVTTLLRCLGIPTRSVTNFQSAHDTDGSMTIDSHWTTDGEPEDWRNDSIWNFHVWNESWLKRSDLPAGNDGWQAHDATPQEESQGAMRCGPAPLNAIKEGHVYLNYDIPFIFAEVNGDRVHWVIDEDGFMAVTDVEKHAVGQFISTKAVGSSDREDITNQYKYPEGSEDERRVVRFVNAFSNRSNLYDVPKRKDVTFELGLPDNATIGEDFSVIIRMKNNSERTHDVNVSISVMAAFYTGIPNKRIKDMKITETLGPHGTKDVSLDVSDDDYQGLLNCEAVIQVYAQCKVPLNKQTSVKQAAFYLKHPQTLKIEMPDRGVLNEPVTVTIKMSNPLKSKLTGGIFHIEGSGLTKPQIIREKKSIGSETEVVHKITIIPSRVGERELLVDFSCNEMAGVAESALMLVSFPQ